VYEVRILLVVLAKRRDDDHECSRDKYRDEKQTNLQGNDRYRLAIFARALSTIGLEMGIHIQVTPSS
jgi:hypothetical protein